MGDTKRLALTRVEKSWKEGWLDTPLSLRLRGIKEIVIMHPQFVRAIKEIRQRVGECVRYREGMALSIIAPTGAGKSTLAKYCKGWWQDRVLPDITLRRVVTFTIPPKPSSSSMSSALLKAMGEPKWSQGKTAELKERALHLLKKCRTRLVLIDNVHDVPERRSRKGVREVGNWFRDMIDEVPALFVMLGAEQSLEVINANNQARRRNPARLHIRYFSVETAEETKRYLRFLHELDKRLPLVEMSNLADPKLAARIWIATSGILDYLMDLVFRAVEFAVEEGREQLNPSDFEKAFERVFLDATPEINPFNSDAQLKKLDSEGEPFYQWLEDGYE